MPQTFLDVENWSSYDQFYVCTSESPMQWEGTISKKRMSFHWFSHSSEKEATWISLIGWPHETSIQVQDVSYFDGVNLSWIEYPNWNSNR